MLRSAIYEGPVVHERMRPRRHRLRYSVFSLLLDLDELPDLDRRFRLFGYNRWAPLSFHDRDHGPTTGEALRPWVEGYLRDAGIDPAGVAIRLLCYPRMFGYAFNPLSVYFCYRRDETLAAILYEVRNTHKEKHTYVIPAAGTERAVVRQTCAKEMYVSPFIAMDAQYHFRIVPPGGRVNIVIREEDADGLLLAASFRGQARPFTGGALARILVRFPLMTLKIVAGIHWEACRLLLKGLPVFRHEPAAEANRATVVQPDKA
tara:strand:+ start:31621 stop:32403 length:783 start_codon:yes stop_codon:yes gene_type:complete